MSDTNSITREEVYDIVRDSIGIPNPTANPPGDAQVPTVGYLMKQQAERAQYQAQGLLAPPSIFPPPPPVCNIDPAHIEARHWYLDKCINVLQESNRIRRDEALMREIRMYLRMKREEATNLIDEIG